MKKNKKIKILLAAGIVCFFIILITLSGLPNLVEAIIAPIGPEECHNDSDCKPNEYCSALTKCQPKKTIGEECDQNRHCLTNYCGVGQGGKKYCIEPKTGAGAVKWAPIAPTLQINIPTLQPFTTKGMTQPDEEGYVYIPFIGQYIAGIYTWAVGIAGLIAVVLIIMGGFVYLTSGGNAQRTQEGKDRITSALFGLLLLLGSYVLLYTINPDLVKFKSLRIKIIERKQWDDSIAVGEKGVGAGNCGGVNGQTQELASGLGLSGDLHRYASYSTKYGSTCEKSVTPKAIILHYTGTNPSATAAGVVKDWSSPSSPGVICQIIVDGAGNTYQVTDKIEEHVVCHGSSSGFNYNDGGIGIEIMGANTQELLANEAQKQAVIALVKKIATKYSLPLTNSVDNLLNGAGGIFTHQQITKCEGAPNRKSDPGEEYAKIILEDAKGMSGAYIDWSSDSRCQK